VGHTALPTILSAVAPRAGPSVAPNPLKANTASTDHHLYVLEAAGLLIGFEEITTPEVRGHYTACRARAF
jgi:hypothetical protein